MNLKRFGHDEKGTVLPLVAIFILFVGLGLATVVVDGGVLYNQKRQMVTSADAGALAGAIEMALQRRDKSNSETQIEELAIAAAKKVALENGADNSLDSNILSIIADAGSVNEYGFPYVEVEVTHDTELYFAKVMGINSSVVRASAVARSEKILNPGIMPLFILEGYVTNQIVVLHEKGVELPSGVVHYSSDLLDINGGGGGTSEMISYLVRESQLPGNIVENLESGVAYTEPGGKTFGSVFKDWFTNARAFTADPEERKAYMTVFIPVLDTIYGPNEEVTIIEFAEYVLLDFFDQPKNKAGLESAFNVTINSGVISVDYTSNDNTGADILEYGFEVDKNSALIFGYFTGKTIAPSAFGDSVIPDTIYEEVSTRRYFLVK